MSSTRTCGTYYLNELPGQPIGECVLVIGRVLLLECVSCYTQVRSHFLKSLHYSDFKQHSWAKSVENFR